MGLRVVFFGTPAFAVPTLDALVQSAHEVGGVVTQPDRPRGRGQKISPEAVKLVALRYELPVLQPERLKDPVFLASLQALSPDLGVVAAYGRILPAEVLAVPRLGMINVHASLLPRWRGAAPVHRAILAGDRTTGVTIMRVVQALDAGPVLSSTAVAIGANETSLELEGRLAAIGSSLLTEVVDRMAKGTVAETPQDEHAATYAHKLGRSESEIDWAIPATAVHNQIRGLQPWPLAAARLQSDRVLFLRSALGPEESRDAAPGTILSVESDALIVGTRPGTVRLLEVQPEGRPAMSVRAFLNGRSVRPGDRFTPL